LILGAGDDMLANQNHQKLLWFIYER